MPAQQNKSETREPQILYENSLNRKPKNRQGTQPDFFPDAAAALAHSLAQISGRLARTTRWRSNSPTPCSISPSSDEQSPAARAAAKRGWRILKVRNPEVRVRRHPTAAFSTAGEDQEQGQRHAGPHGHSAAAVPPAEGAPGAKRQQRAGEWRSAHPPHRHQMYPLIIDCLVSSLFCFVSFRLVSPSPRSLSLSVGASVFSWSFPRRSIC